VADPFTQTYQAIRAALLAWPKFSALVKPGNFPDMSDTKFERFKPEVAPGDLPEVALLQGAFKLTPFGCNSRVFSAMQTYPLIATFNLLQVTPVNVLNFEFGRAMLKAGENLGLPFIRTWDITASNDDAFGQQEWKRGTMRWVSVSQITVQMDLDQRTIFAI